jgi:hypothetical protein
MTRFDQIMFGSLSVFYMALGTHILVNESVYIGILWIASACLGAAAALSETFKY